MTDEEPDRGTARDLDPAESWQDSGTEPVRSRTYRAMAWLVENVGYVIVGSLLAFIVGALILGWSPPRELKISVLFGLIAFLLPGRSSGRTVSNWLWDPRWIHLVDIDARVRKGSIVRIPSQEWREWDVVDGDLDWVAPTLAFGKDVDLENQEVEGCWRGTLSDRELLVALQRVRECREQLEADAKRGFAIRVQAWSIVRSATRRAVMRIISTFEQSTLPDRGDGVGAAIDDALEQFDLDDLANELDDDDPVSDVAGVDFDGELSDLAGAGVDGADGGVPADD